MAVNIGIIEVLPPNSILPFYDDVKTEDLWQYCAGDIKLKEFCILTGVKEIMVRIIILKLLFTAPYFFFCIFFVGSMQLILGLLSFSFHFSQTEKNFKS